MWYPAWLGMGPAAGNRLNNFPTDVDLHVCCLAIYSVKDRAQLFSLMLLFMKSHCALVQQLLLGGDWNMNGLWLSHHIGNGKSPRLTFTPSFFRGVGQPPTRNVILFQPTLPSYVNDVMKSLVCEWAAPGQLKYVIVMGASMTKPLDGFRGFSMTHEIPLRMVVTTSTNQQFIPISWPVVNIQSLYLNKSPERDPIISQFP